MPEPVGDLERGDAARAGQEAAGRVLGVDAELEGVAPRGRVLGEGDGLARGDAELLGDQVDAGGFLGDRVLDLQAGVDLQEGDQPVRGHQVLDGSGAVVAGLAADGLGRGVDGGALLVAQERRGRLLDELLVAALQRAVAGADDHDVAVRVGQDLGLDVARLVQEAFHVAFAAAEGHGGLAHRGFEGVVDFLEAAHDLDAAPAAAEGRLDGHRQAEFLGEGADLGARGHGSVGARHQRGVGAHGDLACGDLVAQGADRVRGGADPGQSGVHDGLREVGVLGQEAVARVHGVGARAGGDVKDLAGCSGRCRHPEAPFSA